MPSPRVLAAALAVALAVSTAARAQTVRGTVTDTGSALPVAGAIVRLLALERESTGVEAPPVLSDERGRFLVRVPYAGRWIVEVKRIGVRPVRTAPMALVAGEDRELRLMVAPIQPRLSAVRVLGESRCAERVASARETATLWEEVRAALTATRITSETEPRVRLTRWSRRLHPRTRAVIAEQQRMAGEGNARFLGASGERLSRDGYIVPSGAGWTYSAPDAEGLLSPEFVRDHCFRPAVSDTARGLVGLAFEPAADRRLPDIAGVLWLDAATSELRRLEYTYTRLPLGVRHEAVGGYVDFARRANGSWIVRTWAIRMPEIRLVRDRDVGAIMMDAEPRPTVTALLEEGGEAMVAAPPAADPAAGAGAADTVGEPRITGTVWDSTAGMPLVGARVTVEGLPYASTTDERGAFELRLHDPGTYTVAARHPRVDSLGAPPPSGTARVRRGATRLDLALPSASAIAARLCPGGILPSTGVVHGRARVLGAATPEGEWKLSMRWRERVRADGVPEWRAVEGRGSVTVGPDRRFVLCDVPAARELRLTLVREGDRAEGEIRMRVAPGEIQQRDLLLRGGQ